MKHLITTPTKTFVVPKSSPHLAAAAAKVVGVQQHTTTSNTKQPVVLSIQPPPPPPQQPTKPLTISINEVFACAQPLPLQDEAKMSSNKGKMTTIADLKVQEHLDPMQLVLGSTILEDSEDLEKHLQEEDRQEAVDPDHLMAVEVGEILIHQVVEMEEVLLADIQDQVVCQEQWSGAACYSTKTSPNWRRHSP